MPSVIKLVNGETVYATQDPMSLLRAAAENLVITANPPDTDDPDTHVVVSNILTIVEGERQSPGVSFG